jgi:hypothetical protein
MSPDQRVRELVLDTVRWLCVGVSFAALALATMNWILGDSLDALFFMLGAVYWLVFALLFKEP